MNCPQPPNVSAPMYAATVTRPIVVTAARRTPAMISGVASGSYTRSSRARGVSPMPSAASWISGGTERNPATMLR